MTLPQIDVLKRSKRKTLTLIVLPDGQLEVRAPLRLEEYKIWQFIERKSAWIAKRQDEQRKRASSHPPHCFQPGEAFFWLGNTYPLAVVETARLALELRDGRFLLATKHLPNAREVFERWYKAQARSFLEGRLKQLAHQFAFSYKALRLSNAGTRWGSCHSSTGSINLSWRLVMAPVKVIDYVILHELAHLRQANHSARFWALVESMLPDYKLSRKWLKDNGYWLTLD